MNIVQRAASGISHSMKAAALVVARAITPVNATAWRRYIGNESYAGKHVTPQNALQLATVWSCIRLIAETISTLPMFLYERQDAGGRVVAWQHPLMKLLHDQPNADMTAVEFWEAVISQICLWGNAYVLKTYNTRGEIISLDPLRPDLMHVTRTPSGAILYKYSAPGQAADYNENQVWHMKGFGLDGLLGLSPISFARNSLGSAMAADEASGRIFANGMRSGGAINMPGVLNKEQRKEVRESMAENLAGASNTGKLMVLEGGATYTPLAINPDDAQMLQTRSYNVEEICRWFRVPPSMVGHSGTASNWGTGLEQQMLGFLTFSLRPYLSRVEQGIKKSLLTPTDRMKYFAEFSLEGLMRADSTGRAALYASAAQNGWMTRNEIRELENWPRVDGGDSLTVQVNLVPIDKLGQQLPPAAPASIGA